ncbi:hypothetical protein [Methanorbis furvi]|uniref:hypothetical protein n=1 Tax=Methanorbis furvi TaxID=3028299 RepID=UPI0030B90F65
MAAWERHAIVDGATTIRQLSINEFMDKAGAVRYVCDIEKKIWFCSPSSRHNHRNDDYHEAGKHTKKNYENKDISGNVHRQITSVFAGLGVGGQSEYLPDMKSAADHF